MSGVTSGTVPDVVGLPLTEAEALLSGRPWRSVFTSPPRRPGAGELRAGDRTSEARGKALEAGAEAFEAEARAAEAAIPRDALRVLRQQIDEQGTAILTIAVEAASDSEGR